ncbi:octaprenyl diphosphate synthase [Gammaproteobacteria bacterium SCGC AG-212-F23]|nr:octaprenyl diphosphate synthase [Gammaproteobacteria bacterium SCGC AG-212-F23]
MPLAKIRSVVQSDIEETDVFIGNELRSEVPLINEMVTHIISCGGKRIRPLLVLLAARAFDHQQKQHIQLAAAIELIHTATLLHDDVVDNSTLRRGQETANTLWGNKASVLVGDFLYSRAFQLIVKLQNLTILNIFSNATNLIAEGEVLQLINCNNPATSEAAYFEVIQRKTGKLFEVAAQTGAALSNYTVQQMHAMQQYGMQLGIAYQLIDDALDYKSSTAETGKNIGNDLAEGKPTLPLIYALQKAKPNEIKLIQNAIQTSSDKDLNAILSIIESTGAIEYTANTAKQRIQEANTMLSHIPDSPYRKSLYELAEFVVERSY